MASARFVPFHLRLEHEDPLSPLLRLRSAPPGRSSHPPVRFPGDPPRFESFVPLPHEQQFANVPSCCTAVSGTTSASG